MASSGFAYAAFCDRWIARVANEHYRAVRGRLIEPHFEASSNDAFLPMFVGFVMLALTGCAFDIVHVRQVPVTFSSASEAPSFVLLKQTNVSLGTGFPTVLRGNTTWNHVGTTEFGAAYSTKDQIVKVEASNIYEAFIVVSNQCLTGFYLPVEKKFSPLSRPLALEIRNNP